MRFEIAHITSYAYTGPVTLAPHVLRLRPREDASQRLVSFDLDIRPEPQGTSVDVDAEGNRVTHAWFDGPTTTLEIQARFVAETLRANPFDFVIHPASQLTLPMRYPAEEAPALEPYRQGTGSPRVAALAKEQWAEVGGQTLPYLTGLARRVRRDVRDIVRRDGPPLDPEVTLAQRGGSCRDQAVVFIDACRAVGIAARFVSGYHEIGRGQPERDLHAWGEVYLGGAGWRGFDPSSGEAVADRHIAVAAGRMPRDAAPLQGAFLGQAGSTLWTRVEMRTR